MHYELFEREKRLKSKIYFLEDKMLRSRNIHEIERLRADLTKLRKQLQEVQWEKSRLGYY